MSDKKIKEGSKYLAQTFIYCLMYSIGLDITLGKLSTVEVDRSAYLGGGGAEGEEGESLFTSGVLLFSVTSVGATALDSTSGVRAAVNSAASGLWYNGKALRTWGN